MQNSFKNRAYCNFFVLGCSRGYVAKNISSNSIEKLILCDTSEMNLKVAAGMVEKGINVQTILMDEENLQVSTSLFCRF